MIGGNAWDTTDMQSMQGKTRCDWLGLLLSLCIVGEGVSGVKQAALETCFQGKHVHACHMTPFSIAA